MTFLPFFSKVLALLESLLESFSSTPVVSLEVVLFFLFLAILADSLLITSPLFAAMVYLYFVSSEDMTTLYTYIPSSFRSFAS